MTRSDEDKENREGVPGKSKIHRFRLFVAGEEANSKKARKNLEQICKTYLSGRNEIEIVDVLEDFNAALENNVLVTPTLIVIDPPPRVTILGTLDDTAKVLSALELGGGES